MVTEILNFKLKCRNHAGTCKYRVPFCLYIFDERSFSDGARDAAKVAGGGTMKLRSHDAQYLAHVERWWNVLLPRVAPFLYSRGGPIVMVQVRPNPPPSYFRFGRHKQLVNRSPHNWTNNGKGQVTIQGHNTGFPAVVSCGDVLRKLVGSLDSNFCESGSDSHIARRLRTNGWIRPCALLLYSGFLGGEVHRWKVQRGYIGPRNLSHM